MGARYWAVIGMILCAAAAAQAKQTQTPPLTYVILHPGSAADIRAHGHCRSVINRLKQTPILVPVADPELWINFTDRKEIGVNPCLTKYNPIFEDGPSERIK